jgi:hypothetical protein
LIGLDDFGASAPGPVLMREFGFTVENVCLVGYELAWELVKTFLAARFSGAERHRRRLIKVAELENKETRL